MSDRRYLQAKGLAKIGTVEAGERIETRSIALKNVIPIKKYLQLTENGQKDKRLNAFIRAIGLPVDEKRLKRLLGEIEENRKKAAKMKNCHRKGRHYGNPRQKMGTTHVVLDGFDKEEAIAAIGNESFGFYEEAIATT